MDFNMETLTDHICRDPRINKKQCIRVLAALSEIMFIREIGINGQRYSFKLSSLARVLATNGRRRLERRKWNAIRANRP